MMGKIEPYAGLLDDCERDIQSILKATRGGESEIGTKTILGWCKIVQALVDLLRSCKRCDGLGIYYIPLDNTTAFPPGMHKMICTDCLDARKALLSFVGMEEDRECEGPFCWPQFEEEIDPHTEELVEKLTHCVLEYGEHKQSCSIRHYGSPGPARCTCGYEREMTGLAKLTLPTRKERGNGKERNGETTGGN